MVIRLQEFSFLLLNSFAYILSFILQILEVQSGNSLQSLSGHDGRVYSLTNNNSGSVLLSCSQDKTFMVRETFQSLKHLF